MDILISMTIAFVILLSVVLAVALGQIRTERRAGVRLALDQATADDIWVTPDGRRRSLVEQRGLLQGRDD
jgi:hypothetical protein